MARVSTYLDFLGKTEEAFTFYKSAFGIENADAMGAYWGVGLDRFAIRWMFTVNG
jgi:uncharacterized glyoxalase superfamily protein PhnB